MKKVSIINFDFLYDENNKYQIQPFDIDNLKSYFIKKEGWIYISKNKSLAEIKIGRTSKTPWERAKSLSTSGLLHDYEVLFALPVKNSYIVEKNIHIALKKYRVKQTKELFLCSLDIAIKAVENAHAYEKDTLSKTFKEDFFTERLDLLNYRWVNSYFDDLPF